MKRLFLFCAVAGCLALVAGAADVADGDVVTIFGQKVRRVPKNTTVEMWGSGLPTFTASDGQTHDNIGKNSSGAGLYAGSSCLILLEDGAKLKIISSYPTTSFWPSVLVTNGCHAILDAPDGVSFNRCVAALGTGTLTITNAINVGFGHNSYWPYLHLKNVKIAKSANNPEGTINGFNFPSASRIVSFPVGWENWSATPVSPESTGCCLVGENMTEGWTTHRFPSRHVRIANPAALGSWQTIPSGYDFHLLPLAYPTMDELDSPEFYANWSETFVPVARADKTFSNDFTFADATSTLTLNYRDYRASVSKQIDLEETLYTGRLTGSGILRAVSTAGTSSSPARAYFAGDASAFTGTVTTDYKIDMTTPDGTAIDFVLSNDVAQARITSGEYGRVTFASATTPATRPVAELQSGTYAAAADVTVAPTAISGVLTLTAGTFQLPELGDTGAIVAEANGVTATYGGAEEPAMAFRASSYDGTQHAYGAPVAGVYDAAVFAANVPFTYLTVDVPANATVSSSSSAVRMSLGAGESATVEASAGDVTVSLAGAGTFTLDEPAIVTTDWRDSVSLWYDFSTTNDVRRISEGTAYETNKLYNMKFSPTCLYMERVLEKRDPDCPYVLWNRRYYQDRVPEKIVPTVYPGIWTEGYANDTTLGYLTMNPPVSGGARRLPFANGTSESSIAVQTAIVVYNSKNGGGSAVLGTANGSMARTNSKTSPFLTANTVGYTMRTNGVAIVPTEVCPNGDWQIVTIGMNGQAFNGLGWSQAWNVGCTRGMDYGELLLFTNAVGEATVLEAEMYLARKWNLPYDFAPAEAAVAAARAAERAAAVKSVTNTVVAIGSGAVVGGRRTLRLGGSFEGTVDLQGGRLILDGGKMPYSEDDVAAVSPENRIIWMDPDDAATVTKVDWTTSTETGGTRTVKTIVDKVNGANHPTVMHARANLLPNLWELARGLGPERGWLDFNRNPDPGCRMVNGTMMRLHKTHEGFNPKQDLEEVVPVGVQTAFFVQDSLRGGGSPLRDASYNGKITARPQARVTSQIWPGTCTAYQNGETRLDGVTVDQTKGFGGKPEVVSVRGTDRITSVAQDYTGTWVIGNVNNTESPNNDGEIIGEMLLYSNAVSDVERAGIEAYLMQKWIGYLPEGFTDARQATIGGTGAVEMASFATMPKIAADFSGTVSVDGDTATLPIAVDLGAGTVSGAIVNALAAFTLPASVTVDVTCSGRLRRRSVEHRYTLLDVNIASDTVLTWNLSGAPAKAAVVQTGTKYELVIPRAGFLMYVK